MTNHPKKILIRRHTTIEEVACPLASLIPVGIRYPAEKIIRRIPHINEIVFVSSLDVLSSLITTVVTLLPLLTPLVLLLLINLKFLNYSKHNYRFFFAIKKISFFCECFLTVAITL
jgi:hypothetical protein